MSLKFRLKGLAETFVDNLRCPKCGHEGGDDGDHGFLTERTRVTFDGIIVVVECRTCTHIFVPEAQRLGVINSRKLRSAVEKDSENTGQPLFDTRRSVQLEVEKLNAERGHKLH